MRGQRRSIAIEFWLLSLLLVITYLYRVCISVAARMQDALHIGPIAWGWVTGIFTLSCAAFEIPSGALGDRIGPRRVLTRIVLWWSGFTSLTGLVTGYYPLLLTRFLFGMGEAGAFPNASVAVARWFPVHERGLCFWNGIDGQSAGWRDRSHPCGADPGSLRMASIFLRVWDYRSGLERGLALVVSRRSGREAGR